MKTIPIAEQFYSIQGEGPCAGTPAVFLRLAGCNLSCGLTESDIQEFEKGQNPEHGATWICDTIDVWREADEHPSAGELVEEWEQKGWTFALDNFAHLVLTGGEPMVMGNQKAFEAIYGELVRINAPPFVEVETNGTIRPKSSIVPYVDQWNVSMKLSNSGMDEDQRIKPDVIDFFKKVHEEHHNHDATFKFVVAYENDLEEIARIQYDYDIPDSMMSLMPAGQTREQLRGTYPKVAEWCKSTGWSFSPRLHVNVWDQATGV